MSAFVIETLQSGEGKQWDQPVFALSDLVIVGVQQQIYLRIKKNLHMEGKHSF